MPEASANGRCGDQVVDPTCAGGSPPDVCPNDTDVIVTGGSYGPATPIRPRLGAASQTKAGTDEPLRTARRAAGRLRSRDRGRVPATGSPTPSRHQAGR